MFQLAYSLLSSVPGGGNFLLPLVLGLAEELLERLDALVLLVQRARNFDNARVCLNFCRFYRLHFVLPHLVDLLDGRTISLHCNLKKLCRRDEIRDVAQDVVPAAATAAVEADAMGAEENVARLTHDKRVRLVALVAGCAERQIHVHRGHGRIQATGGGVPPSIGADDGNGAVSVDLDTGAADTYALARGARSQARTGPDRGARVAKHLQGTDGSAPSGLRLRTAPGAEVSQRSIRGRECAAAGVEEGEGEAHHAARVTSVPVAQQRKRRSTAVALWRAAPLPLLVHVQGQHCIRNPPWRPGAGQAGARSGSLERAPDSRHSSIRDS